MELKITVEFHDKITDAKYCVGDVVDFSDDRAKDILKLGFGETVNGEKINLDEPETKKSKRGKRSE